MKFTVLYNPKNNPKPVLCFYGKASYMPCTLVKDAGVNLERFENIGNYLKNTHIKYENEKEDLNKKLSRIKEEYAQPFNKQDELEAKEKRLSEVNALVLISNKENVEKEQTSRLEAIQSRSVDIANPCTEAYVNLANTQLDIHGSPWKPSFDKEIAKALSQRGFDKEQIVNTIFIYSPSAPTKDEAISLIAEPKKQIAACR